MDLHGFVDIQEFRVRFPKRFFPAYRRDFVEVCLVSDQANQVRGWFNKGRKWLSIDDLGEHFPSKFSDKNPLNIPGPIYGAETDTCCTGPHEAPDNVLLDEIGQEFVFKQASNANEFRDLVRAAVCECFEGYGIDGDSHWRLSTIRDWWRIREDMLRQEISEQWCNADSFQQWKRALQGDAEGYLQVYAFFVENGRVPNESDVLPDMC